MIQYFPKDIEREMIKHAMEEFPNESCGLIVSKEYKRCENIADNKRFNFRIPPKIMAYHYAKDNLEAVIHSHADETKKEIDGRHYIKDFGHASKDDMERQVRSKVPYGVVHLNIDGNPMKTFYFGDELPVQDLIGRPFVHGVYDCYGLLRDYYRKELDITLNQYPREYGWWNFPENSSMILDYCEDAGFERIEFNELEKGDVVNFTILAKMVNHCAVYIGGGLILHHLANRLSCREPLMIYKNAIGYCYRYKESNND